MEYFQVYRDYDQPPDAGFFRIDTLIHLVNGEESDDVTYRINQERYFHNNDELKSYISDTFDIPTDEIEIEY